MLPSFAVGHLLPLFFDRQQNQGPEVSCQEEVHELVEMIEHGLYWYELPTPAIIPLLYFLL